MRFSRLNCRRAILLAAMAFTAEPYLASPAVAQVKGTEWGFAEDTVPTQRHVVFDGGGRLTGFGGCNRFSGSFELADGKLKVGAIVATRRACSEDVMKRESEFFALLENARMAEAVEGTLVLKAEDGSVLATMVRRQKE